MQRQLVVLAGKDKGKVYPLPETGSFTIGRGSTTDTKLTDARISRAHCQLEIDADKVLLKDNKSTVGTFVNNQQISDFLLHSGDVIKIGDTEMRYDGEDIAEAATVAGVMLPSEAATVAGQLLAPPSARQPGGRAVAVAPAEPMSELIGTTVGHYSPTKIVAQGQTSVVFRAQDTTDDRVVALKVLRPEASKSEGEMQRLARLLKPLASIKHPNLMTVYDLGKDKAHCWFALEYVDGDNLSQVIQRIGLAGMLDWQHALRIGIFAAKGLQHLHEHKFTHRALTPRCILINSYDKQPKVGGLTEARPLGEVEKSMARPDEIFRNVAYLPPERARGDAKIDGRADIYGLGATLFALLTGRPPFDATSPVEVIAKVLQADPPRPKDFQFAIPDAFERIVLRCLAKKPEDRYAKVSELVEDLERVKKVQGIPTEPGRAAPTTAGPSEATFTIVHDCGQSLSVRKKFAGTQVRCPRCKQFLVVPGTPSLVHSAPTKPMPHLPTDVMRKQPAPETGQVEEAADPETSKKKLIIGVAAIVIVGVVLFVLATFMNPGDGARSTQNRPSPGDTPKPEKGKDAGAKPGK